MIQRNACYCGHCRWKLLQGTSCLLAMLLLVSSGGADGRAEVAATPQSANRVLSASSATPEKRLGTHVNRVHPVDGFRQLLLLANPDQTQWATLASRTRLLASDLPLLLQLLFRVRQVATGTLDAWTQPAPPMSAWLKKPADHQGELAWFTGTVRSLEAIEIPDSLAQTQNFKRLYQCQLELESQQALATVVVPKVPARWLTTDTLPQPVRLRGLLLGARPPGDENSSGQARVRKGQSSGDLGRPELLLLSAHLAWYPTERAPPGQLLLAAHGMDVALLDDVQQRQPFVKPGRSREHEAFYACLLAARRAGADALSVRTRQQLPSVVRRWRTVLGEVRQQQQVLRQKIAAAGKESSGDLCEQSRLEQEQKAIDRRAALAATVVQRARQNQYSIAPLFLEPEKQVGCLTLVEGVARRAVKIVITQPQKAATDALINPAYYYELEVFTADSQNLPVVCCVSRLPAHFPLGDAIREPVRVAGFFFKSWLYRTRLTKDNNEVGRPQRQRISVPVVIGAEAERLPVASVQTRQWPLVAGIGFLVLLAAFWVSKIGHARRERRLRTSRHPAKGLPPQWPDTNENQSPP